MTNVEHIEGGGIGVSAGDKNQIYMPDADCERCGSEAVGVVVPMDVTDGNPMSTGIALCDEHINAMTGDDGYSSFEVALFDGE